MSDDGRLHVTTLAQEVPYLIDPTAVAVSIYMVNDSLNLTALHTVSKPCGLQGWANCLQASIAAGPKYSSKLQQTALPD